MSDEPIPDDFLALCRDRLLRQRGDAEVVVDGERLLLAVPGQPTKSVGVHNLWRSIEAFRDTPQSLTGAVDEWARTAIAPAPSVDGPEELLESLRVVIRSPAFAHEMHAGGMDFAVADLVPGAPAMLVSDSERAVRYVDSEAVAATGLSDEEAFQHAAERLVDELNASVEEHLRDDGVRMFTCGGTYEASLMVVGPFWDREVEQHGPLLVAIPARDLCFAAPKSDPEAVSALEAIVRDCFERDVPYLLVPNLYERVDGRWVVHRDVLGATHGVATMPMAVAKRWVDGADVPFLCNAPGLVTLAVDGDGTVAEGATEEDLRRAMEEAVRAHRAELETDDEGITTLSQPGGGAVENALFGAWFEEVLGADSLLALPSRDVVLTGSVAKEGLLRARAAEVYAAAGTRQLTTRLYRLAEDGHFAPWPTMECSDCGMEVAATDGLCWNCHEAVWDGALLRWIGESLVVAAGVFGVLWLVGAAQEWRTILWLWFLVSLVGWVPRASLRGGRRPAVYGPWVTSGYRWFLALITVGGLVVYPEMVGQFVEAIADGVEPPEVTFIVLWTAMILALLWTWFDIGRHVGWSVLLPWVKPPRS